jgi:hypothetical protein
VFFWVITFFLPGAIFATNETEVTEYVHRVLPGESLNKIAYQYLPLTKAYSVGDLVKEIKNLNGIQGTLIHPNQHLLIPLVPSDSEPARTIPKDTAFEAKGIYLNRYSIASQKMGRLLDKLIASEGNTVIIDGKDMAGRLSYASKVNLAQEIGANTRPFIGDPARLFQYLHKKGLHVAVRLVVFFDPLLAAKKPEMMLRTTTGAPVLEQGKAAWVDPSQSAVQNYNLAIAKELAQMGVDEIQFDYIRFPTTRSSRKAVYGPAGQKIPRHVIITDFLAKARKELAPYKVLLSIDVFGILAWGRKQDIEATGQNIEDLAKYCDVISPMIYPSHFDKPFQGISNPRTQPFLLVSEACRRFSTFLEGSNATLRPWIQAFPWRARNFNKNYIIEELRALHQSKARGWLLWSAGNVYRVAWRALAQWNQSHNKTTTTTTTTTTTNPETFSIF